MRVVVTGAAGFIGSHLAEALVAAGHEVVGVDAFVPYYPRSFKEENIAALVRARRFELRELDLRTDPVLPVLDGADAVVNLAAMPGLPRSWSDFESYLSCNVLATHRLVEASVEARIAKFLHISTSSVYGLEAVGDESQPTAPVSPYGATKLAAEHVVLAYVSTRGLPATILRYFSIYGPRQRPDMAYRTFIDALIDGRPIQVFGDGLQSRSNTYIEDCVAGTVAALDGGQIGEIYNIGGGREITLNEALAVISSELGARPTIERLPARTGDQRRTAADTSKARTGFGYEPRVDPEDGLREQVRWAKRRLARA